jgi:hypothetical protein
LRNCPKDWKDYFENTSLGHISSFKLYIRKGGEYNKIRKA